MGLAAEVARTWRAPRAAALRQFAGGANEARTLALLMGGSGLVWLAQWPRLRREAIEGPTGADFAQLVATALFGWLMLLPLLLYLAAGLTHVLSRALGGRGAAWQARRALAWAWFAATPAALLAGAAVGLTGASALSNLLGIAWIGAVATFWAVGHRAASTGAGAACA